MKKIQRRKVVSKEVRKRDTVCVCVCVWQFRSKIKSSESATEQKIMSMMIQNKQSVKIHNRIETKIKPNVHKITFASHLFY